MDAPRRIQLSRAKGWRMPENTVKVDRSTRWGNSWRVGEKMLDRSTNEYRPCLTAEDCVEAFRNAVDWDPNRTTYLCTNDDVIEVSGGYDDLIHVNQRSIRRFLAGKNLACWCARGAPCHADVLLEIANRPVCEAVP
jgi:hypothetical protein